MSDIGVLLAVISTGSLAYMAFWTARSAKILSHILKQLKDK